MLNLSIRRVYLRLANEALDGTVLQMTVHLLYQSSLTAFLRRLKTHYFGIHIWTLSQLLLPVVLAVICLVHLKIVM